MSWEDDEKQRFWDESNERNRRMEEEDRKWRENSERNRLNDLEKQEANNNRKSVSYYPDENSGGGYLILIIIGIVIIGFILDALGNVFEYIHNLVLAHWIIAGGIFIFSLKFIWQRPKTNFFFKISLIAYCIYGIFTSYTGYKMSSAMDNWIGDYQLIAKTSKFENTSENKPKKKKRKKKKKEIVTEQQKAPLSFSNANSISIKDDNIINFTDINKSFKVEIIEYPKHFQRVVTGGNIQRYPVCVISNLTSLDDNKKTYWVNMTMIKDTLNISWSEKNYIFNAKYINIK